MKITLQRTLLTGAIPALFVLGGCAGRMEPKTDPLPADAQRLRGTLDRFQSFALAKAAGYNTPITDCMSNGDEGAMGIHYGNTSYIDGTADPEHPEALIYEPGTNGEMSLVGVEFIIPYAAHPKSAEPPTLFGQKYSPNDVFGVWGLHVWTHRLNPRGTFAAWNPRVHC